MSLQLPEEIVAERFVPTARVLLARELHERGLTQQAIADRLGITQAAVSNHLNGRVEVEETLAEDPRMTETIDRIAAGLAAETMDEVTALGELLELVRAFEDRGPICELHEEAMPSLRGLGCDLCVRGPDDVATAEREALASVRRASRRLASERALVDLVPNVGTNLGTAVPGAADPSDVAAIPGRCIRMRGRIEVPSAPEFGASRNVAAVTLAASAVDPDVRGAVNLATDEGFLAAARERGIDPLAFDPDYDDRRRRLEAAFAERGEVPLVCYHEGAFGVEPVCYVLGETALEAVELAASLASER